MVEMLCGLMLLWATLHTPVLTWLWVVGQDWLRPEPPPGAAQPSPDDGLGFYFWKTIFGTRKAPSPE